MNFKQIAGRTVQCGADAGDGAEADGFSFIVQNSAGIFIAKPGHGDKTVFRQTLFSQKFMNAKFNRDSFQFGISSFVYTQCYIKYKGFSMCG